MIKLSKRLSLIASLVPEGCSVCDVGCDHGYLAGYLYLTGKYRSVTATDIRYKPLKCAEQNLKKAGASGVKTILCDGLSSVSRQDADTVIIAGMGGEVISRIISDCEFSKSGVRFILQPMTGAVSLRVFLAENGYEVTFEEAVEDEGRLYSVMVCSFSGKPITLSTQGEFIGILKPDGGVATAYIKKQYNICRKCAESLKDIPDERKRFERYASVVCALEKILEENHAI